MSNAFDTSSQLELAIIETVNGTQVSFPRLEMPDIAVWANEIHNKRINDAKKRHALDMKLTDYDRQVLIQRLIDQDIQLGEVVNKSLTPDGIKKTLVISLKKAGKTDEESLAILKAIHFRRQFEVAQEILSAPPEKKQDASEGDGSANPTPPDTDATGD